MTTKREKRVNGIIFAGLMLLAVIYILPIIMMVLGSLKDQAQAGMFNLRLPSVWKFDNYLYVIKKGKILSGYRNSLLITVPATALSILCGAFAGIVLSRRKGKSAGALYYYFIFGLTITLQIAATFDMFKVLGIYGSMFSVILIFAALRLPFTVMTFCSFVKSVPQEIDEAAHMDGCNFLQLVFHILFPVMKPILVTNIVVSAIDIWNNFMIPLFYLPGTKNTIPLTIYNFYGQYARDWQYVFCALTLTILPMLILFLVLQKYIVEGMVAGSVKG